MFRRHFRVLFFLALVLFSSLNAHAESCESLMTMALAPSEGSIPLSEVEKRLTNFESRLDWRHSTFTLHRENPAFVIDFDLEKILPFLRNPKISSELWTAGDFEARFFDVGFKDMEFAARQMNRAMGDYAVMMPTSSLRAHLPRKWFERVENRARIRWRLHDRILKEFTKEKDYLHPSDIDALARINARTDNYDVFGLFSPDVEWGSFNDPSLIEDWQILATIQVSYLGDRIFEFPTERGILEEAGFEQEISSSDLFPFEARMRSTEQKKLRKRLEKRFNLETSCEFTRYGRFGMIPTAAKAELVSRAFEAAEERHMRTIFAHADESLLNLYKRMYSFKVLTEIPTQSGAKEYLLYLEVGGPEYRGVRSRQAMLAEKLTIKRLRLSQ